MVYEFKSKVGWWYHLVLAIMAISCILAFVTSRNAVGQILLLLFTMLMVYLLVNTWYKITDDELIAHSGFFPEKHVKIAEIDKISFTHMPIASYALSLDRIVIYKEGKMWLLISPKRQDEFVKLLKKRNENIQIDRSSIL